jgi:uncharacterized protein YecE (DUF72 family)
MTPPNLFIGVAGSCPDWTDLLAADGAPDAPSEIAALSRLFDLIEITSSYYHPPDAKTAHGWLAQTRDNARLQFVVRVWQKLVRERSSSWRADVETMKRGLLPLQSSRRLGGLVLPFPHSFRFTHNNEEWLWRLLDAFTGFPLVVEMPHASWRQAALLPRLPALGVAVAAVDQAHQEDNSPPAAGEFMHRAYLRLNGRHPKWLERSASRDERFDYFYHAEEISSLAAAVRHASNRAESCYVVFHNYPKGQAFANALQLQFALAERRMRLPENLRRRFPMLEAIAAGAHSNQLEMF